MKRRGIQAARNTSFSGRGGLNIWYTQTAECHSISSVDNAQFPELPGNYPATRGEVFAAGFHFPGVIPVNLDTLRRNLDSINKDMLRVALSLHMDVLTPIKRKTLEKHYSALTAERDEIEKKIDSLLDTPRPDANIPV